MVSQIKLAEMLCTRLCHDITGPVGAISNGVEFLSEEAFELQGQAVELIAQSAEQCVARLQYYRSAYGRTSELGETDLTQTLSLIEDFFIGSKVTLDWPPEHRDPAYVTLGNKQTRLLLNLIIIASATLIRGGQISIRLAKDETSKSITITATGTHIKWEEESENALVNDISDDELTPSLSQIAFTHTLLEQIGWEIALTKTVESFTATVHGKLES